jgi:hypothetical protein
MEALDVGRASSGRLTPGSLPSTIFCKILWMAYGVNYRSYAREGTNPTNSEIPWHKTKYDYGQNELWLHGDIFLKISNPTFEVSKKILFTNM